MDAEEVAGFLATLPRCKQKGTASRPAWYVDNRLVCRLEDASTLIVRTEIGAREHLLAEHPETFGVAPRMELHQKVQVVLDHGNDEAVRAALQAAYDLQRKR